ncbi:MAG: leucine-rich repeat domain-containing protein [Aureispira sp.]|nr:leucine-rich repeat domain-containing protein [Aureispira sp.]
MEAIIELLHSGDPQNVDLAFTMGAEAANKEEFEEYIAPFERMFQIAGEDVNPELKALRDIFKVNLLDLSFCDFEELPGCLLELNQLEKLILEGNELSGLPRAISKMPNLNYLCLIDNNITALTQFKIEDWLPECDLEW